MPFAIADRVIVAVAATGGRPWLDPDCVLPGNGAAELLPASDAAEAGVTSFCSWLADYRALTWGGRISQFRSPGVVGCLPPGLSGSVEETFSGSLQPHNPTGQLWSRASLEPL